MRHGFFAAEHLHVVPVTGAGGAAIVPAVVSEDEQFGYSNPGSILTAAAKGLQLKIVAEGNQTTLRAGQSPDSLVGGDHITNPKQLAGKTVAIDTLGGLTELTVRTALQKAGVDPSKVTFLEVGFPDMLTALDAHRVDAAKMNEPFLQQALAKGYRELAHPFTATLGHSASISEYFTSARYAAKHPDVVAGFQRAINRSLDYAAAHPKEVRALLPTYTKIAPKLAKKIRLTKFTSKLDVASLKKLAALMVAQKQIDKAPDIRGMIWAQP